MRTIYTLLASLVLCSGCGDVLCGEHIGDALIKEPSDTAQYSCHTSVTGIFQVNVNRGLSYFEMPHLESIGGSLLIQSSHDLENFDLNKLEYVKGDVRIKSNAALLDLNGLSNLSYIGGDLRIYGWDGEVLNRELSDISGLGRLESVAGDIEITNNPKLPACAAEALVEQLKYFPGIATIADNDNSATCGHEVAHAGDDLDND